VDRIILSLGDRIYRCYASYRMDLATLGETVGLISGLSMMFMFVSMLGVLFGTIRWLMPRG